MQQENQFTPEFNSNVNTNTNNNLQHLSTALQFQQSEEKPSNLEKLENESDLSFGFKSKKDTKYNSSSKKIKKTKKNEQKKIQKSKTLTSLIKRFQDLGI